MMHINGNCLEKLFFKLRDYDQEMPKSLQTNPRTHWRSSRYAVTHVCNKNSNTQSITVPYDTVILGAIGFMSIINKSGRTLVDPNFCSADTWSWLFYILEALL